MQALVALRKAGFTPGISPAGGLLIEPASRLTTAQREFVKAHKVLLLAELRAEAANDPPMVPPPPMVEFDQDAFEERAAILEFEAGFSRDEAERRAMALMTPVVDPAAPPMVVDLPAPVVDPLAERVAELVAAGWAPWNARARAETESTAAWQAKMGALP